MAFVDDIALADRLRLHNPEQFHTLVRMHLSFVLDLNTDEYESGTEKGKARALKWSFVPFCKKSKCVPKEGVPLTQNGILQIAHLISFLSLEQNISQEGIFRRSGKMTRQQELKNLLNNGLPLNLDCGNFTAHDCASVLKNFLAELSESLLTDAHYPAYCQIAELCAGGKNSEGRLLRALQLLLLLLPSENRALLQDILQLLNLAASNEKSNKMSAENLATLFTPHLLCPRKLTPEALHINSQTMSGVIAFMIQNVGTLFKIPPKLAVDIRAYWAEKERRRLSPKKELNESVCDGTANTVFSFVDRERTAQAHVANPTETALAQLYAHIQSLPESSKKRKLVKQFNKENGQGTPVHQKNHHRSRSLGDSIKKHILSKGLRRAKACIDEGQYTVTRSQSQEALNKKYTPSSCMRLFRDSIGDDSPLSSMPATPEMPARSSGKVVLKLHYSQLSESELEGTPKEDGVRKTILQDLANQIAVNHDDSPKECRSQSSSRKRISSEGTVSSEGTPPKIASPSLTPPEGEQGINSWPVSSSLCVSSALHPPALPNKLTPRNAPSSLLATSTPAARMRVSGVQANHSNCLLTPIADENNSMSPITRSAQRMPKSMQETMMTPRSRKPVVLLSGSNLCHLANVGATAAPPPPPKDLVSSSSGSSSSFRPADGLERSWCESGDSLTSTFRSYLLSRSVLTASPVDLSFSSRTGDFDTSSSSGKVLSDSLVYCLNGNDPEALSDLPSSSERPVHETSL